MHTTGSPASGERDSRHTAALLELNQKGEIEKIGGLSLWRPVETIEVTEQ